MIWCTPIRPQFMGRKVNYGLGELDELVLPDAWTIHRARLRISNRGYHHDVPQPHAMLLRNLVYTGVPRPSAWWCSSASGRLWRSPSRERGHGGGGRSSASG